MPASAPTRKFDCSIAELYAISRLCWNSCLENMADFTAFKTTYSAAVAEDALAEIAAAEALPNEEARELSHAALHLDLKEQARQCLQKWRALRRYINGTFAMEYRKMNVEAAGGTFSERARKRCWTDLQQLLVAGREYMDKNIGALIAAGMPADFPARYEVEYAKYRELYDAFKDAEMDAQAGTIARMRANNRIYEKMQAMNFDGQTIYADDPRRYFRFVFSHVQKKMSLPTGIASNTLVVEGAVKNGGTQQPLANLPVTLHTAGAPVLTAHTNERGRYVFEFKGMTQGTLLPVLKVAAAGFLPAERALRVTIGKRYLEDVVMVPEVGFRF